MTLRAILLLFDSLNRHCLSPYGCDWTITPNFQRLARHTVRFDRCYAGSLPCMPARRELHTGRYNFLHRSWGPIEPYDDSMPQILKQHGVYTHLISDHQHYWEDGGATYHTRYNSWECVRGQEGDPWKAQVEGPVIPPHLGQASRQDTINRAYFTCEEQQPLAQVFQLAQDFLEVNRNADNWLLHVEPFDPHEPFFTQERYQALYPDDYDGPRFDWPDYARVTESLSTQRHCRNQYGALLSMCDTYLGRLLDTMDRYDLWKDTMLIVATDHGFLLGEHDWWAKNRSPFYEELVHTPLFIWDPREKAADAARSALVQTIDLAPTLLRFFNVDPTPDMQGHDLRPVLRSDTPVRESCLFGMHGSHVCVTDGRYVYMRADRPGGALYDYTLLPLHQRAMYAPEELRHLELAPPFSFTKGCSLLKVPMPRDFYPFMSCVEEERRDLLFDLDKDPHQVHPLQDRQQECRLIGEMVRLMRENDAPAEQFARLGLETAAFAAEQ